MRTFTDATGLEWTVYEVKRKGGSKERWSYLPDEFGDGWLCFDSGLTKRRLTPTPPRWHEYSDRELSADLARAQVVPRARAAEDRVERD